MKQPVHLILKLISFNLIFSANLKKKCSRWAKRACNPNERQPVPENIEKKERNNNKNNSNKKIKNASTRRCYEWKLFPNFCIGSNTKDLHFIFSQLFIGFLSFMLIECRSTLSVICQFYQAMTINWTNSLNQGKEGEKNGQLLVSSKFVIMQYTTATCGWQTYRIWVYVGLFFHPEWVGRLFILLFSLKNFRFI